jgi:hypothetical protein
MIDGVTAACRVFDSGFYKARDADFGHDQNRLACDLCVIIMTTKFTGLLNDCEPIVSWRVVAEHVKRVFAGMETRFTRFDIAFVLIGFAYLELEASAFKILVESLVGRDCFCGLCFDLLLGCGGHYSAFNSAARCL